MVEPNLVNPFGSPHGRETEISKGYQRDADRETGLNVVIVAEEVGFEPTVRFHARRFSRPVP